jgi:DNA polymerase-3 subunit beta
MTTTTFSINRKVLREELALLVTVLAKKSTIPVLESVMMGWDERLTLTASSLDITMISEVELPAALTVEHDAFCLPLRELHRLVSLFECEDVSFTIDRDGKGAGRILVQGGKSKHKLPFWEVEEYPKLDVVSHPQTFTVSDGLIAALTRIIPCASSEDNCPAWQYGVQFEGGEDGLTLAASDSHRLGYETIKGTAPTFSILASAVGLKPLLGMEDGSVTIEVGSTLIGFQRGPRKVVCHLIEGSLPNWRMIIPKHSHQVEFNSKAFTSALKRAAVTRDERANSGMKFTFSSDSLIIETATQKGEASEPITITSNLNGNNIEIGINPDYLNSYLTHAGENVTCELGDSNSWPLFSENESNFKCVIASMRL